MPPLDRPDEFQYPELFSWEVWQNYDTSYKKLNAYQLDKCTIMQCTGIKAIGNTDVYEGDILELKRNNETVGQGVVMYLEDKASYMVELEEKTKEGARIFHVIDRNFFDFYLLGNKYDKRKEEKKASRD
jgi:hypothetical protein